MKSAEFRRVVWKYYKDNGRHDLPWRKTTNPYRILVSEVMLQQTQVERVIPFYKNFLKKFPTPKKLAAAPLSDVLKAWQGLGYNRRAKMLHQAASMFHKLSYSTKYGTNNIVRQLEQLSGVGPYTARAIAAFAYNIDVIFIETNIRTAIIHHFFPNKKVVSDSAIQKILEGVYPKGKASEWHSALMDYGAHLKRSGISHNAKSKTYTKQAKFSGSLREARGAILRELSKGAASRVCLMKLLGVQRREQMERALEALRKESLIEKQAQRYLLAT